MQLQRGGVAGAVDEEDVAGGVAVGRCMHRLDTQLLVAKPATDRREQSDLMGRLDSYHRLLGLVAVRRDGCVTQRNELVVDVLPAGTDGTEVLAEPLPAVGSDGGRVLDCECMQREA